ncbi:MAG: glycosyltransferase family 4 protein [Thermoguttaceae bacterium]
MKIGLVIDCFDPRRGGAQEWTRQYAQRLLARGHEVHVVTQSVAGGAQRLPIVAHCLGAIGSHLGRAAAAEAMLRTLDLDVIHDIGVGWHCDVLQSEDGSRIAMWEHRLKMLPPWLRGVKRQMINLLPRYRNFRTLMARQFDASERIVVAISQMCARDFQQYHGVAAERIRLVYHGIDVERFSPGQRELYREAVRRRLGIRPEEMVVLFAGHDHRRKGLATAVRAVRRLRARGAPARLLVIGGRRGSGAAPAPQRRGDAVLLLGPVEDPVHYYAAADALVLPSFYDPFGLVVLEAAACGLPVVASRWTGASELLHDGLDGYVLDDPADDASCAERLERLLDPVVRQSMGEAARRLALQYTLDRNCDALLAIYQERVRPQRRAA